MKIMVEISLATWGKLWDNKDKILNWEGRFGFGGTMRGSV
jgi:hypothetical protein